MGINNKFSYGKSILAAFAGAAVLGTATAYGLPDVANVFNVAAAFVGAGIGRAIYRGMRHEGKGYHSKVAEFVTSPQSILDNITSGGLPGPKMAVAAFAPVAYAVGGAAYDAVKMGQRINQERKASKKDSLKL